MNIMQKIIDAGLIMLVAALIVCAVAATFPRPAHSSPADVDDDFAVRVISPL